MRIVQIINWVVLTFSIIYAAASDLVLEEPRAGFVRDSLIAVVIAMIDFKFTSFCMFRNFAIWLSVTSRHFCIAFAIVFISCSIA